MINPPIIGSRWADKDRRESGRVIEVESASAGTNCVAIARVVAAPEKPWTVGRSTRLRFETLYRRYRELPSPEGLDQALAALDEIAAHPTSERNPDGDEQAAETMALLAREHADRIRRETGGR